MTHFRCPDPVCQMDRARLELMDEQVTALRETLRRERLERVSEESPAEGTVKLAEAGTHRGVVPAVSPERN